jgi:hypothetical protein
VTITLGELKTQSRQRADMVNSQFVSDAELTGYLNNSIAELHDILSESYGSEYFLKSDIIPIVSGTEAYNLPADFYDLKGVDVKVDSVNYMTISRYNFNERNRTSNFRYWDYMGIANIRYRLVGQTLRFSPMPDRTAECRIWYVPLATKLVDDTDTLEDFNAYSEFVIVDAAIKMMQKEESDVTLLVGQKQMLEKRIREKSQHRDANIAPTVTDVYQEIMDPYRRGSN